MDWAQTFLSQMAGAPAPAVSQAETAKRWSSVLESAMKSLQPAMPRIQVAPTSVCNHSKTRLGQIAIWRGPTSVFMVNGCWVMVTLVLFAAQQGPSKDFLASWNIPWEVVHCGGCTAF
jgi:hypothetical protein